MTRGDLFPSDLYNIIVYDQTAQVRARRRGTIGEETFHRALREYGRRWVDRHPYPNDFFNTFDNVSRQDLSWFWNTWFYNAWPLDQAIGRVVRDGDSLAITIEDHGLAPMPVKLAVTRTDGTVERIDIPFYVWLKGARVYVTRVARGSEVKRVEIDPDGLYPDLDRANQVWVRP